MIVHDFVYSVTLNFNIVIVKRSVINDFYSLVSISICWKGGFVKGVFLG